MVLSEQVGFKLRRLFKRKRKELRFYLNKWDLNGSTTGKTARSGLRFYLNKWDLNFYMPQKRTGKWLVLSEQVGFKLS